MSEAGVGGQSLQGFLADWDASAPIQDGMDGMVTTRMTLHPFRIGDPELKLLLFHCYWEGKHLKEYTQWRLVA